MWRARFGMLLVLALLLAGLAGACGDSTGGGPLAGAGNDGSASGDDATVGGGDGPNLFNDAGEAGTAFAIAPLDQTIDVAFGQKTPTLQYSATIGGTPVHASFAIDRGEIADIDAASGVMTPGGKLGGKAKVTATYQNQQVTTSVTVRLHLVQNGDPSAGDAGGGAGGNGGVGGEGPGGPVDAQTQGVLQGNPAADSGLAWLYPYDKTVWPRGLLAPLLQWNAPRAYDAVFVHIVEDAFEYQGYFAKTAAPFVHHPVPQAAWTAMSYSNAGEDVLVTLIFAAGGQAYGPIQEKWKIASTSLKGTVYYNSYGTGLALNFCCTALGAKFGGATLAIKHGATDPVLVAGSSGGSAQCRVCHSVSADGSQLVTQHGDDYAASSAYGLQNNTETAMNPADFRFEFPALSPDGTFLFSNSAPLPATNPTQPSALYAVPSGSTIPSSGLPSGLRAGTPVFSPDGKHVAFNDYAGPSGDQKSLAAMDFAANAFSGFVTLHTPSSGKDIYPSFLPTNDAVVFELETASDGEFGATRNGSRGELWWVDLKTKTTARLDLLNGHGYVPTGPNNHGDDATLNYEPTVNPVPSGGYAWVVFTSRRRYGNVATIDPFWSDPRDHDISTTPTTKKLWVAAVDLNASPGTDPSHPAFYLPAQELLAGNSRGYWVVDPCQPDGTSCETGDECCGGYCKNVDGGFVCSHQPPPCSQEYDKCATDGDCCGSKQGIKCINGRCAQQSPQ